MGKRSDTSDISAIFPMADVVICCKRVNLRLAHLKIGYMLGNPVPRGSVLEALCYGTRCRCNNSTVLFRSARTSWNTFVRSFVRPFARAKNINHI